MQILSMFAMVTYIPIIITIISILHRLSQLFLHQSSLYHECFNNLQLPCIFISRVPFFGALRTVCSCHITGAVTPSSYSLQ